MLLFVKYEELDFTHFTCEAVTTIEEWIEGLLHYDAAGPTKYELYDLRKVEVLPETKDIQQIADLGESVNNPRPLGAKTALLVSNKVQFGLARMYCLLAESHDHPWETEVFYALEGAVAWLGIDLSDVDFS